MMENPRAARLGYWAALSLFVETAVFFASLAGLFGASGDMVSYFICAFLPASFITMISALHALVPPERRLYTRLALAFASVYAAFCTSVYFLQLSIVRTNPLGLSPDVMRLIEFTPGSATFAIDMLGYGFMCLAAAALVPTVLGNGARDRWLRGLLIVKGLMAIPTVAFPPLVGPTVPGAPAPSVNPGTIALMGWCLVFMPIVILFAGRFKAMEATPQDAFRSTPHSI